MCFSAMVQQNAKDLGLRYHARIQTELYADLFHRRLAGEKLLLGRGLESNFLIDPPQNRLEQNAAETIRQWHQQQITKIESEIFKQKTRLNRAIESLRTKETKKAKEDVRIATEKIEKLKFDHKRHQESLSFRSLGDLSESDSRIFPMHYVSILALDENGERVIMPIRYLMRPHGQPASFDQKYSGCYNARFDSLSRVAWWKNVLGRHHGIMFVRRFFENVPTDRYLQKFKLSAEAAKKKNQVICFEPDGLETMFVPVLWDVWHEARKPSLFSGALITDDPLPEIAATGHDRTPIFLRESAIEAWLSAKGTPNEIKEILLERERPTYKHRVLSAA